MSVDALNVVFGDLAHVPPGVQAVLVAVAWRTPPGGDVSYPTSYTEIAHLTHQSRAAVARNVARAVALRALEVVWAREGSATKYRVNRGGWHVPDTADMSTDSPPRLPGIDQSQFETTPTPKTTTRRSQNETPTSPKTTARRTRIETPQGIEQIEIDEPTPWQRESAAAFADRYPRWAERMGIEP